MVLSKKTYDALPYLYIGMAFLIMFFMDSRLKYLPALVLLFAGLLILAWRKSARRRAEKMLLYRRSRAKTKSAQSYSVTNIDS